MSRLKYAYSPGNITHFDLTPSMHVSDVVRAEDRLVGSDSMTSKPVTFSCDKVARNIMKNQK